MPEFVCFVRAAYDYFPCQHQIFYHLKGGKSFWYDPVFQVTTMAGEVVWRRRHYRVKQLETPGSFAFSVLDNGVTSLGAYMYRNTISDMCDSIPAGALVHTCWSTSCSIYILHL